MAAVGTAIDGSDADEDVVGVGLGVLHGHVEVTVAVEDAGVDQLVLGLVDDPVALLAATRSS